MSGMRVNMNNVRKRMVHRYNGLAECLNSKIDEDGIMIVYPDDIQEYMDDLRMLIGTIAMSYDEDNDDFKDVFTEIYPEGTEDGMVCFNPDAE